MGEEYRKEVIMTIIEKIEKEYCKNEQGSFNVGDTVKLSLKVVEGEKTRTQNFEGIVIKKRGRGTAASFTVLKRTKGSQDTIEKTFPLFSPMIQKIKVVKPAKKIRRAKLYYMRKDKK